MALYRRGKIWWIRKDPVTGQRRSTQCRDKKAAQLYEAERERLAADPAYAAAHNETVGDWADRVIAAKETGKAAGTAHMYRVKLGHVVRIFGRDAKLADITPRNVDAFIETRQSEGASNNTIGKELTSILQLCKMARRAGAYTGDIDALRPVGFSIGYKPRERVLTRPELAALLESLPPHRMAAVALAVATGARHSELQRITAAHVDTGSWLVHIPGTKTEDADRVIPVAEPFRGLLSRALPHLPVTWARMAKDLPEACEALDIPPVTPNDLRRTAASWLIEAGVAHGVVSKILGHRGPQMVHAVYGRETPAALGEVISRQIRAGTQTSHSSPIGSVCAGRPLNWSSCFLAVAPERLELSHPEGPGILNPGRVIAGEPIPRDFRSSRSEACSPKGAESRHVGTRTSQSARYFRALSWGWFRRVA